MPAGKRVTGSQEWEGFWVLCEPRQLLGLDRRATALIGIVGYVLWQATSFLVGLLITVILYATLRKLSDYDPHILTVLSAAASLPSAWYDPGLAPGPLGVGPVIISDPPPREDPDDA